MRPKHLKEILSMQNIHYTELKNLFLAFQLGIISKEVLIMELKKCETNKSYCLN